MYKKSILKKTQRKKKPFQLVQTSDHFLFLRHYYFEEMHSCNQPKLLVEHFHYRYTPNI